MRADIICLIAKDFFEWPEGRRGLEFWLQLYRDLEGKDLKREADRIVAELRQGAVLNRPLNAEDARLIGGVIWDHFNLFTILYLAWHDGNADPLKTACRVREGFGEMADGLYNLEHHQRLWGPLEHARMISRNKALPAAQGPTTKHLTL